MSQADDIAAELGRIWADAERHHYLLGLAIRDAIELLDPRPPQKEEERISR